MDWKDPLEKGMATHSSILAWRIPWTEEAAGLQSTWSQRVGDDRETNYTFQGILFLVSTLEVSVAFKYTIGLSWQYSEYESTC